MGSELKYERGTIFMDLDMSKKVHDLKEFSFRKKLFSKCYGLFGGNFRYSVWFTRLLPKNKVMCEICFYASESFEAKKSIVSIESTAEKSFEKCLKSIEGIVQKKSKYLNLKNESRFKNEYLQWPSATT